MKSNTLLSLTNATSARYPDVNKYYPLDKPTNQE
jgi:hypothetical protein